MGDGWRIADWDWVVGGGLDDGWMEKGLQVVGGSGSREGLFFSLCLDGWCKFMIQGCWKDSTIPGFPTYCTQSNALQVVVCQCHFFHVRPRSRLAWCSNRTCTLWYSGRLAGFL